MEIVLYAFFALSLNSGDFASSFPTLQECEEVRAKVVREVEKEAPKLGEAVFVSTCEKVLLKVYKQ